LAGWAFGPDCGGRFRIQFGIPASDSGEVQGQVQVGPDVPADVAYRERARFQNGRVLHQGGTATDFPLFRKKWSKKLTFRNPLLEKVE